MQVDGIVVKWTEGGKSGDGYVCLNQWPLHHSIG